MENYLKDLTRLENFSKQYVGSGLFSDPSKVHHSQIRRYNLDYVKTVKFNPKTKQFEPYDKRTGTFYNEKDAKKFIEEFKNPYYFLAKDYDGRTSINFGIYGIPETILVNQDLKILKKYVGPLDIKDVNEIKKIIKK